MVRYHYYCKYLSFKTHTPGHCIGEMVIKKTKVKNKYAKGANFERQIKKDLEKEGAIQVFRTAGSHSPYDLIALYPDYVELIQCKASYYVPKKERDKLEKESKKLSGTYDVWLVYKNKLRGKTWELFN